MSVQPIETVEHASYAELEALLDHLRAAPRREGTLDMIVRRPISGEREVLEAGLLDTNLGLVGDWWSAAGAARRREEQITLMCSRAVDAVARGRPARHQRVGRRAWRGALRRSRS